MDPQPPTVPRSTAEKVCWGVALLGVAATVAPFTVLASLGSGRFALVLLGPLAALTALLVIPLFRGRQRVAAALADDRQLLARWALSEGEWLAWVGEDAGRERRAKWQLFAVVLFFSVGIGMFFVWMDPSAGPVVLGVLLGLCAIIAAVIPWRVGYQERHRRQGEREVRIGRDGLRLGRELHVWRGYGARLEQVEVGSGTPPFIEISYSTRAKNQRQINVVRVPIPRGGDVLAAEVVVQLRESLAPPASS